MDKSSSRDSDVPDRQDPTRPPTPFEEDEHESSDGEVGDDSARDEEADNGPPSSAAEASAPAPDEEAASVEGPTKEPPDSPRTRERRIHAAANKEYNSRKKSKKVGRDGKVRGACDSYTRRESITIPFKKVEKLVLRRRSSKDVDFDKKAKVMEFDGSSKVPLKEVPHSPVFEEKLRPKGEVPNKAGREAARVAKAHREHEESFKRRLAKSQDSSTESRSPGLSALESMNLLSGVKVVDDLDQRRISRGQTSTMDRARAGESPKQRSTSEESHSSTRSSQASEDKSPDRDPPATGSYQEASEEPQRRPSTQGCGQPIEQPASHTDTQPPAQATSNQASVQSGQASRDSAVNRENHPPAARATAAGPSSNNSHTTERSTNTVDNTKAPTSDDDDDDDDPTSDHVVDTCIQFGIVYDRDPSIAIRSLDPWCDVLNNVPSNRGSGPPAVLTATLQDVSPAHSQRYGQPPTGSDVSVQDPPSRGFGSYVKYCLNSLDELGDQLWPDSDDTDTLSSNQSSGSSPTPDDVKIMFPNLQDPPDGHRLSSRPPSCVFNTLEGSPATVSSPASVCYFSGTATSHGPIPPGIEESYAYPAPILAFDTRTCAQSQVDPQGLAATTSAPKQSELMLTETNFEMATTAPLKARDVELFGQTLEEAYNTYCMAHCSPRGSHQFLPALDGELTSANAVQRSFDSQYLDIISDMATCRSENDVKCSTRTKLSRIESWFSRPVDSECKVRESLVSQVSDQPRASSETTSLPRRFRECDSGAQDGDHIFTPVDNTGDGVGVASEESLPKSLPFRLESNLKESHASRPQKPRLSTSNSSPTSPQDTPTRTTMGSSDFGLPMMCEDVIFRSIPRAPKRSSSHSTDLSEQSIVTALNDLENLVPGKGPHLDSLTTSAAKIPRNQPSRKDSVCDTTARSTTGSRSPVLSERGISLQESHESLAQKRSGSALSVITSFSSHSKASGTSKASAHSGSSSGSSSSSTLPYGFDGTSKSWRPYASKTQASVGVDQHCEGSSADPSGTSSMASRRIRPGLSGPDTEAMKKFVVKHSPTKPNRCAAEHYERVEVRKVVKKRSSLLTFFGSPLPKLDEPEMGSARRKSVDVPDSASKKPCGSDSGSSRTLTVDDECLSSPLGDVD